MSGINIKLPSQIKITRSRAATLLAALAVCAVSAELGSETYKLLTYYPAPYGSYKKFVTTGDTWLARDGGSVAVGLQTATAKMEIKGDLKISSGIVVGALPDAYKQEGALRYNSAGKKFEYRTDQEWKPLGDNPNSAKLAKGRTKGQSDCETIDLSDSGFTSAPYMFSYQCPANHSESGAWSYSNATYSCSHTINGTKVSVCTHYQSCGGAYACARGPCGSCSSGPFALDWSALGI